MVSNATIIPLRTLTPDKEALLRKFYAPSGMGLFLATYLPLTICLSVGGAFFSAISGLVAGLLISALSVTLRQLSYRSRVKKASYVYEYGAQNEIQFSDISSNYSFKVNGAPQQIITVLLNGQPIKIKTFKQTLLSVYMIPQQVAYTHPDYSGTIVPSGLFNLVWGEPKKGFARVLRWGLISLPYLFVLGFTFFISSSLDSAGDIYAQPDALVYQQGGNLLMASVVTQFEVYEESTKGTYGNDYTYAEAINLNTGKKEWKTELDAKGSRGDARLLGQSGRYLFFLRGLLYVVDKTTGNIAATNKDFPNLQNKMSTEPVAGYDGDAAYRWSDSLNAVVVKGTDGLYYTIDGNTLRTGTTEVTNDEEFFKNPFHWGNNYEDQLAEVYDNGTHCYALLDVQDTVLLAHNGYGVQERSRDQSVRRKLYRCSSMSLSDSWANLGDSVYLFGGFLIDATQRYRQPDDTIAKYASYQSLAKRYNHTNAPLQTGSGAFLMLHKTTIELSATLEVSAVSHAGSPLWQVRTGFGSIPLMYHDAADNTLYLFGRKGGGISDKLTEGLCVDLGTGSIRKIEVE